MQDKHPTQGTIAPVLFLILSFDFFQFLCAYFLYVLYFLISSQLLQLYMKYLICLYKLQVVVMHF